MKTPIKAFIAIAIVASMAIVWPDSMPTDAVPVPVVAAVGLVAAPAPNPVAQQAAAANANQLSPSVREVFDLVKNGVDESVIRNYIAISLSAFKLTPEQIIFLKQQGVSDRLVTAMLQHGMQLKERERRAELEKLNLLLARLPVALPAANPPAPQNALTNPNLPPPPANLPKVVRTFYNSLVPHGTWLNHSQFGWVWNPTVARNDRNWRPYSDGGRWLATDQGWYWQSDYTWGSIPFHYGRWTQDARAGWIWFPDNVWGPSWVTWRMSGNYLGWAPLPPGAIWVAGRGLSFKGQIAGVNFNFGVPYQHYTFVPNRQVFHRKPGLIALAPREVSQIFRQTSVVNNLIVGDNNVVVNNGIPVERIASYTSDPIRLVSIQTISADGTERVDRLAQEGNGLVIYRPTLQYIAPVKLATLSSGGTDAPVLLPRSAPDNVVIAGRPVYDYSTGVPVVTGYTTSPERRHGPGVVIINNVNNSGTDVTTTTTTTGATTPVSSAGQPQIREGAPGMIGLPPLVQNNTVVHQQVNQQIVRNNVTTVQQSQFGAPAHTGNRLRGVPVGASRTSHPGFYTLRPLTPPQPITSVPRPVTVPQLQPAPSSAFGAPAYSRLPLTSQAPTSQVSRLNVRVFSPSTGGFITVRR